MTSDVFKGEWSQLKGWAKEQWGRLTEDDLLEIDGQVDQLAGRLQERYGWERDEALRAVGEWNAKHLVGR